MDAIVIREFVPAERLHLEEVPDPTPGPGQVRIAVAASGIHHVDLVVRSGEQLGPFPLPDLPYIPGREVAGLIDQLGTDVDPALMGADVAVSLGNANGGYARLTLAPAADVHRVDPTLDAAVAVAMVGTGRTAIGMLANAQLTAADTVLITGAAGGLGSLFVQAADRVGATVIAIAGGSEKVDLTATLGADLSIDHTQHNWARQLGGHQPTALLDSSGGDIGATAARLLTPGGRALFFGHPVAIGDAELERLGIAVPTTLGPDGGFTPDNVRRWAAQALSEAATGTLIPQLTTFPLAEAARAHAELEARRTTGKVVLT